MYKLFNRVFKWDIDAYICFRKKPYSIVNFELPTKLLNDGWVVRQVDFSCQNDKSKLANLFLEAYTDFQTMEKVNLEIESAIRRKDLCFVLANSVRFAGMAWLGFENNEMLKTVGNFVEEKENVIVEYRVYVSPELRGFGIQRVINNQLQLVAKKLAVKWVYGFVGVKNTPSVNNFMKTYKYYKLVYHVTLEIPFVKMHCFPKLALENWTKINR